MFVSDIMSTCVTECTEDMRLEEVYERLRQCDHGLVVVVDSLAHRVPIGVVTERSICEQIILRRRNPKTLTAGSVIDSRVKKVCKTDLVEAIADDEQSQVAAVIVVDENRRACGVVSKEKLKDLARPTSVAYTPAEKREPVIVEQVRVQHPARRISEIPAFGWIQ